MTSIAKEAFYGCSSLTAVRISNIEAWCKISFGSSYSNPLYYAQNLYLNGELVTELVIPKGVTSIENYAFYNCNSLTSINIPQNVTSIGGNAFYGCSSLERVTINCANVGNWFKGNSNIKEIILGEDVSSIGSSAFYGCSSLTTITIPESVTSIGKEAFYGCNSLTSINIPERVTSIGDEAFYKCSSLTAVHISNIEAWCKISFGSSYSNPLYYAQNLYLNGVLVTELVIPEGVTSIGNYVFYNCSSLTSINIPEGVASIGSSAFLGCSSLTVITIPEDVTSIGARAFCNCTELLSLHIGANVDSYGDNAFEGCTAIKELTVMGNVIPEVPSENLTSITLYSPIPLETKEFASKVYRNATLNIPDVSLTRYQNADVWKNFWYINEFDPKEGKDIFLTISQADNGYVKQHLVAGSVCTYTIEAAEGWKIHTVTFNGEDVTSQLTEEGTFTTPALQDDATLNIAYEKIDDAIESTRAGAIKVQGHQGIISISGTTEGTDISLYTTDGTLVTRETAEGDTTQIAVPTGQVYIVKVADTVVKIGM